MGQLRREWLALATQDRALFYIALSHYAGNYGLKHQESDPAEALRFRMEAMRLVNERIPDIKQALADGTVGTVASLSSYEVSSQSYRPRNRPNDIHFNPGHQWESISGASAHARAQKDDRDARRLTFM
jgi:hypothetical protein